MLAYQFLANFLALLLMGIPANGATHYLGKIGNMRVAACLGKFGLARDVGGDISIHQVLPIMVVVLNSQDSHVFELIGMNIYVIRHLQVNS